MAEVFAARFELVEPIADGGMGSVWVVRDLRDEHLYAGKLLRQSDSSALLRFMREQSTRIQHPHVVTPLSWAGEDDRVLFTMPLVRGGSVATLIGDHGGLPPAWTGAVLDQVLDALEAVHAAGLVHRDVKPANVLLHATGTGPPHVLLADFGVAARLDEPRLTRASQIVGSPGYLAPEQLAGADPDPRQDVYAVGMVGLEMVTGARPPGSVAEAREVRRTQPDQAALVDLLLSATDHDPAQRPGVSELRVRLRELRLGTPGPEVEVFDHVATGPTTPPPTSPPPVPTRVRTSDGREPPTGQRRDRIAGLVLLVVALACLVGAGFVLLG